LREIPITDKASEEWLNSLKDTTRKAYKTYWVKFLEFTNMTGDQIFADRKDDWKNEGHKWERMVLQFKQWMLEAPKKGKAKQYQSPNSARGAAMVARSFFAYYYMPLHYRRQESKRLKEATRITEDYFFSREDLKKMVDVGNLKEKYIVVAGKSFGLRASDFLRLTRGDLEPYISRETPIGIGVIGTGKEKVPAYPFIDSDAQPIIKLMLDGMTKSGRTKPIEKMLKYKWEKQLSQVLKRLVDRAGIETGNKQVRFHCLRKFLIDNLSRFMSESKWKQIIGKLIDEKAYVSSDSLREDYIRTMPETTFVKVLPQQEIELLAKKQALLIIAKNAGITEEEVNRMFQMKKATTLQAQVDVLEAMAFTDKVHIKDAFKKDIICKDEQNCQRLVSEPELETLLTQGWHVVMCLPSGKIVVSNEYA
jgi:integrase